MANVGINGLADAISAALIEYTEEVEESLTVAKKDVAKSAVSQLKEKSPRNRPEYYKGWSTLTRKGALIVRNRTHPGLTHLLEKGHAKRGGGRVGPQVHIEPVEDHVQEALPKEFERVLRS